MSQSARHTLSARSTAILTDSSSSALSARQKKSRSSGSSLKSLRKSASRQWQPDKNSVFCGITAENTQDVGVWTDKYRVQSFTNCKNYPIFCVNTQRLLQLQSCCNYYKP